MTTLTKLEQTRTLSILTQQPHFIVEQGTYVAVAGYVFTYSTFSVLFFWALTSNNMYSTIWDSAENSTEIKELNTHDYYLQNMSIGVLRNYCVNKIRDVLKLMSPDEIENMVDKMFSERVM